MNKNFLIVMDDIATVDYKKDTTLAMMWAIKERGHSLYYCGIYDLWLQLGNLVIDCQPIDVYKNPDEFYHLGDKHIKACTDFDVIVMRKDPPFDMNFIYATYLLDKAQQAGVLVANNPSAIRDCNEKLFATWFSDMMSETIVTAKHSHILKFIETYRDVIVKPLDGMGGAGIFRLTADGPNIGSTLEMLTHLETIPVMAQKYLPEIKEGDKRVLIVGGRVVPYCLARIPQGAEIRGNLAAGGYGIAMPLTKEEQQVANTVAPILRQRGLYFVGLDLIGAKITEINVTSPTCVREIDAAYGTDIAQDFVVFLEELLVN